ncbi:MAG: SPOR domain-containing protein [Treponema sp.]|nr:SPOR domain-containing protein [Treponema sp.]
MDQKKTLWIIAAVGAFLLVVLGAALIMYMPAKKQATAVASVSSPRSNTQYESGWTNSPDVLPPQQVPYQNNDKVSEMIVLSDNTSVFDLSKANDKESENKGTTIDLNTLKEDLLVKENTPSAAPQNINITVNIPESKTPAVEEKQPIIVTSPVVTAPVVEKARSVEKKASPAAQPKSEKKAVKSTPAKNTKTAAKNPAPVEKITQFWVQVAAYSNKKGAENARGVLDENKIPADIFTFEDNKNRLFYRVRIGPYTTKSEAEYWRTRIIQIDEFSKAESYVTSTSN